MSKLVMCKINFRDFVNFPKHTPIEIKFFLFMFVAFPRRRSLECERGWEERKGRRKEEEGRRGEEGWR